ncbi:hypothetical protein M434DRAFT_17566 [Hypoxylon sp. CO27-5]|nr:hypothetical protein M434DRAFT_17566 [Hypoxylon sp. CO27-5]
MSYIPVLADTTKVDWYMVKNGRCTLCQLPLKKGDPIFFGLPLLSESTAQDSPRFFDPNAMFIGPNFEVCCRCDLYHQHKDVDCFHAGCYQSINVFKITPQFRAAIRYSFQPPVYGSSAKYRSDRLSDIMVRDLKRDSFPKRLPNEIWCMIAKHAPMEFLMATTHEQVQRIQSSDSDVDLSRDVYARFIMYGGVPYLKELSNSSSPGSKGEMLLFRSQPTRKVRKIYIAEDHLGVRGIKLVSSNSSVPPGPSPDIPGVWWRRLSHDRGIYTIRAVTDGFKVRDIRVMSPADARRTVPRGFDSLRWQVWEPPSVAVVNLRTLDATVDNACGDSPRMNFFDCNSPDLIGYSVAITEQNVITVHSHRQDTDLSFYQNVKPIRKPILWLYMPIEKDEYVTEIGRFHLNGWSRPGVYIGLAFTTNRGRTTIFGNNDHLVRRRMNCTLLYSPPRHSTRIYFNAVDQETYERGIRILACGEPQSLGFMQVSPSVYSLRAQSLDPNQDYFYSSCRMNDVTSVTPCINEDHPDKLVIGLLFQYEDGHRECVGQMRLDWTTDTIEVDRTRRTLRVGMTKPKIRNRGRPFGESFINVTRTVGRVVVSNSSKYVGYRSGYTWIDVPWYGTLEWWFSATNTIVSHNCGVAVSG